LGGNQDWGGGWGEKENERGQPSHTFTETNMVLREKNFAGGGGKRFEKLSWNLVKGDLKGGISGTGIRRRHG